MRPLVVAIDGPSGVGKSTAAKGLARRLGVPNLDTGAMYRALALRVLAAGVDPGDREAALAVVAGAVLELEPTPDGGVELRLDGEPVGERIRTPEVADATSKLSTYPEVRRRLVALQRDFGARHGAVAEGRDIGSVVFPSTPHKFFLDADPRVRAARRHAELLARGVDTGLAGVEADLAQRDARDSGRLESPLVRDDSYMLIDTGGLEPEAVIDLMETAVRGEIAAHEAGGRER